MASSGSHGVVAPPLLPNLTVYSHGVPFSGFLGLCGVRQGYVSVGIGTATIPAPILLLALRSAAVGYTFGVAFFAPPVYSPLLSLVWWLALCV